LAHVRHQQVGRSGFRNETQVVVILATNQGKTQANKRKNDLHETDFYLICKRDKRKESREQGKEEVRPRCCQTISLSEVRKNLRVENGRGHCKEKFSTFNYPFSIYLTSDSETV